MESSNKEQANPPEADNRMPRRPTRMGQEMVYELKFLRDQYWKLGPIAWLLDAYLGFLRSDSDIWANGGQPLFDKSMADALGTTEEIIEDWRWFLVHEGLVRQQRVKEGGWLIRPVENYEEILDVWLAAWRRLRYLREALWW